VHALVIAYACEPGRGSEPGAGWGVVKAIATFARVTVLVGPEHREGIARYEASHRSESLRFVVVDEPRIAPTLKRSRVTWFLAYLLWLRRARAIAARLIADGDVDLVHHVTYAVCWLPSPIRHLPLPAVWGPVGGGVTTPRRLWPLLGPGGVARELLEAAAVRLTLLLPATRATWRSAAVRIMQNDESRALLPARLAADAVVLNHGVFVDAGPPLSAPRERFMLWVSPMERRKGPRLAVMALAASPPDVTLRMAGDGPERAATEALATSLGIGDRIEFLGRIPREEVLELASRAGAVVFTGLREEGGLALSEALLAGAPVIVLAHGGAGTLAEASRDPDRVYVVPPGSVAAVAGDLAMGMEEFTRAGPSGSDPHLDVADAIDRLHDAYRRALAAGRR
jgi:glycosyltransferase involved in cell wall biosynthesis